MPKKFIQAVLKKDGDKITFVASDETLDRGGEVVPIDSWDLRNFKRNPVLLVNHDYKVENIVGAAVHIRTEKNQLLFEPDFHEITQLSKEVKAMVEKEYLNTVSVGYMPHGPKKDGDMGTNELFEISFVSVPANPSAERLSVMMAKSAEEIEKKEEIEEWVIKQADPDIEDPVDDKDLDDDLDDDDKKIEDEIKDGIAAIKEGRVLSGKNRRAISEAVDTLKNAAAALEDLLALTDTNSGKAGEGKGREPKVVYAGEDKEVLPRPVIRALQSVNRLSNDCLRNYKK